jgi:hypothetical protein
MANQLNLEMERTQYCVFTLNVVSFSTSGGALIFTSIQISELHQAGIHTGRALYVSISSFSKRTHDHQLTFNNDGAVRWEWVKSLEFDYRLLFEDTTRSALAKWVRANLLLLSLDIYLVIVLNKMNVYKCAIGLSPLPI